MWNFDDVRDMGGMWVSHDVAHAREQRTPAQFEYIVWGRERRGH